jgi:hypothetical protein
VTEFITITATNLIAPKAAARYELLFNKPDSGRLYVGLLQASKNFILFHAGARNPNKRGRLNTVELLFEVL